LQGVLGELKRNHATRATQLFLEGQANSLFPTGKGLPRWLIRTIGKKATGKLVDAFARQPCYFCKKGLVPCDECGGAGHFETRPCNGCLGMGIARCEFCDGAGWAAIDGVPDSLRPAVVTTRAEVAMANLKDLLDKPAASSSAESPAVQSTQCANLLLKLNRNIGVLENTVVALGQFQRAQSMPKRKAGHLLKACVKFAIAAGDRVRRTLQCMSESARLEGSTAKAGSPRSEAAFKKAAMYKSLGESGKYSGTSLDHPFLATAVARVARKARAKPTGANVRSEGSQKPGKRPRRQRKGQA
jgi:hypothetical protein